MFFRLAALGMLCISGAVFAEPVYLDCEVKSDKESKTFSVKLDETSTKVTHTQANGRAFNAEGFFAANRISWQNIEHLVPEIRSTDLYEVDRTTLAVVNVFTVEIVGRHAASSEPKRVKSAGTCTVITAPADRKI